MRIPKCDWYHISENEPGQVIVRTDDPRSVESPDIWSPKVQPDGPPRIAVASSVEQCINGTLDRDKVQSYGSDEVIWYVFDVNVQKPEKMKDEDIDDADYNHEHGVTDEVICAEGGEVELTMIGRVLVRTVDIPRIKKRIHRMYIDKSEPDAEPDDCFQRDDDGIWFYLE